MSPFLIRRCLTGWSDWTGTLDYGHPNKQTQRSIVELFGHGVTCSLYDQKIMSKQKDGPGRLEELDPDFMEEEEREDQSYVASVLLIAS